ncbi:ImmA/IrrE family metallo-endopeptidase [Butyrivibrio proteoclasticus]|uniref:ImmA/IrrE family metallo-endopeptidase n=1 Tax=Butyrivibrio proteoclasticus TaxID=43305 RepID=UPI000479C630|nr:ImmA/IrrE family metallo-endopeptidase [Butyrivibrio proteoclasticus]
MDIGRIKRIIDYSNNNKADIASDIQRFYAICDIDRNSDLLNLLQIARRILFEKGFLVFELPFADDEIGAMCYRGDGVGYVVLNTSLPVINYNFALAHEIYHVLFQQDHHVTKIEFATENYYEHDEEYAANLFAGMLIMPENSFIRMFYKYKAESQDSIRDVFIKLMAYYKAPYTAVVIRSIELELCGWKQLSKGILDHSKDQLRDRMFELWLDASVLDASFRDDTRRMEMMLKEYGQTYIKEGFLSDRVLNSVISNFLTLSSKIKGEI